MTHQDDDEFQILFEIDQESAANEPPEKAGCEFRLSGSVSQMASVRNEMKEIRAAASVWMCVATL